uniref:Uncharacterized protein n=1 Tax=Anopheles maculatus TaxID=74869 RepID=A0A182TCK5_9DIPT
MGEENVIVLRAIVEYVQESDCILEVKVVKDIDWSDLMTLQREMASNVKFRTIWIFPTENEVGVTIIRVDYGGSVAYSVATEAKLKKINLLAQRLANFTFLPCATARNYARFSSSMNWNFWLSGNRTARSENIPSAGRFSVPNLMLRGMLADNQCLETAAALISSDSSVFIVCGERDSEKLTELVHFVLETAGKNKRSCRTICVLRE